MVYIDRAYYSISICCFNGMNIKIIYNYKIIFMKHILVNRHFDSNVSMNNIYDFRTIMCVDRFTFTPEIFHRYLLSFIECNFSYQLRRFLECKINHNTLIQPFSDLLILNFLSSPCSIAFNSFATLIALSSSSIFLSRHSRILP